MGRAAPKDKIRAGKGQVTANWRFFSPYRGRPKPSPYTLMMQGQPSSVIYRHRFAASQNLGSSKTRLRGHATVAVLFLGG